MVTLQRLALSNSREHTKFYSEVHTLWHVIWTRTHSPAVSLTKWKTCELKCKQWMQHCPVSLSPLYLMLWYAPCKRMGYILIVTMPSKNTVESMWHWEKGWNNKTLWGIDIYQTFNLSASMRILSTKLNPRFTRQ